MLQQGNRLLNQTGYSIDMTVDVTPKSGPPGTPITISVKGIGWRSLYNSWDLIYDNVSPAGCRRSRHMARRNSSFRTSGTPGDHVLEIVHGALVFPYLNPEQNPAPGRPRFSTTFRVTPGHRGSPAAPQQQAQKTDPCTAATGRACSQRRISRRSANRSRSAVRASSRANSTSSTGRMSPAAA